MKRETRAKLRLYIRPDCGLCREMLRDMGGVVPEQRFLVIEQNVDHDPEWVAAYGDRVPVLVGDDGREICSLKFDRDAFADWLIVRAAV